MTSKQIADMYLNQKSKKNSKSNYSHFDDQLKQEELDSEFNSDIANVSSYHENDRNLVLYTSAEKMPDKICIMKPLQNKFFFNLTEN